MIKKSKCNAVYYRLSLNLTLTDFVTYNVYKNVYEKCSLKLILFYARYMLNLHMILRFILFENED